MRHKNMIQKQRWSPLLQYSGTTLHLLQFPLVFMASCTWHIKMKYFKLKSRVHHQSNREMQHSENKGNLQKVRKSKKRLSTTRCISVTFSTDKLCVCLCFKTSTTLICVFSHTVH